MKAMQRQLFRKIKKEGRFPTHFISVALTLETRHTHTHTHTHTYTHTHPTQENRRPGPLRTVRPAVHELPSSLYKVKSSTRDRELCTRPGGFYPQNVRFV